MINSKDLKQGEEVSIKATVDGLVNGFDGYVNVMVGSARNAIVFAIHETDIFGRVPNPPKQIEVGDTCLWNNTKVKVLCVDDGVAWVKLYMGKDEYGKPTGSTAVCHNYKMTLKSVQW
jgi:hypothetical protein